MIKGGKMANDVDNNYKTELKKLMRTLFEFDYADLDFGIYRIMNKKRSEIERFIEKDLIDAVNVELGQYSEFNQQTLKKEVEVIQAEIKEKLGNDALDANEKIKPVIITTPFAKEIAGRYQVACEKLKEAELSNQHEAEIFTHIYQFFSRYYKDGDFISLRRYSQKEKYAIPYNGEEVLLHWANKDQYYIKTGENFKNYSFKTGEYTIEFLIKEVKGAISNNKNGNRFFVLASSENNIKYNDSDKALTVLFEYRELNKDEERKYGTKNVQDSILVKIKDEINSQVKVTGLKTSLSKIINNDTKRSLLEKHLNAYTKKNTTDYFIHKNLKGFLTNELDFYIKNEVFHLDDLGTENELSVEQYVTRAKVMKTICLKIIDFLSQIEDFQKMLFEKKKFIVNTDYCMTLDNVPEELYPKILNNKDQINEWRTLYGIGEEEQATITSFNANDELYLKEKPYLVLDTKFFDQDFKDKLIGSFKDLDDIVDGLMINSENWQALNLMQEKYKEKIKCVHIDPPYNTATSGFLYKNEYQHSSWLALMVQRITSSVNLMSKDAVFQCHIDENEYEVLFSLFEQIGIPNSGTIIWDKKNPMLGRKGIATQHEYIMWRSFLDEPIYMRNESVHKILTYAHKYIEQYGGVNEKSRRDFSKWVLSQDDLTGGEKAYRLLEDDGRVFRGVAMGAPEPRTDPKYHIPLIHPITKKPCPVPSNGWSRTPKTLEELIEKGEILWGKDHSTQPQKKVYLTSESKRQITSVIQDAKSGKAYLDGLGLAFPYCHPVSLYEELFGAVKFSIGDIFLDYFAGSGTSAHAVLNLNKGDGGNRKYILVEMGIYFDTIMKRRIQKVMFSDNWKDGKPQSNDGISHIFKYQTLEQYEDTLNNIDFTDSGSVQRTLMDMEGYFLRYMLDFETRDSSPCRFNVTKLNKPFSYTLKIARGNELREEIVDLVETFNYLLGIHIKQIKTYDNKGTYYKVVVGKKDEEEIVIVWRDTEDLDLKVDKKFIEDEILKELKPSKTYINADFNVERALHIEPEFRKLMGV